MRERLDSKERDLIEENMRLQMEVVALKDEVSLLMESARDTAVSSHTELRRTASHQMSSSEDEGLADLEVRMRRDSVNDRDSPAEEGVEGEESSESSEDSSSASSYCPILISSDNNNDSSSCCNRSSAGSIAGSESGISGSLFLDNGTQTESEHFFPVDCMHQQKTLSPSASISPASRSPSPASEHPSLLLHHQATSPIPELDHIHNAISATESQCQTDDVLEELTREISMLKEVNQQLLKQNESLSEQVLELEEAENDARSLSQKLQSQVTSLVNQMESLQAMLMHERESLQKKETQIKQYEEKVKEFLSTHSKQMPTTGSSEQEGSVRGKTLLNTASRSSSSAGSTTASNESIDSVSEYQLTTDHSLRKGSSSSQLSVGGGGGGRVGGGSIWNKIHRFEKKIRIRIKSNLTVNGKKDPHHSVHTGSGTPAHVSSIAIRPERRSEPEEGLLDQEDDDEDDDVYGAERRKGDRASPKAGIRDTLAGSSNSSSGVTASGVDEEEEEGEVDDLQVFISEREMMKPNIGSSFQASSFQHPKNYLPGQQQRKNRHHLLHASPAPSSPANHHQHQRLDDVHYDFESQREVNPQSETTGVAAFHVVQGQDASSLQSASSSLPLCETIKPLRIDINNKHQTNIHVQQQQHPPPSGTTSASTIVSSSGSSCNGRNVIINISNKKKQADEEPAARNSESDQNKQQQPPPLLSGISFSQVSQRLVKLEQNERLLRDKLIKLEWINKEFVHELELRERILNSKEADHKELQLIKSTFSHEVQRIQSALDQVNQKLTHHHENELNSPNEQHEESVRDSELTQLQDQKRQLISEMRQKESEFNLIKKSFEEKRKKLESEHEAVAVNLMVRMKDMETESALTVRQLEEQRKTIYHELEACVREFHLKEVVMCKKISSLEQELCTLRSTHEADSKELSDLRDELRESREREAAFKETINRADQIISESEKGYKERIDGLRESEAQLTTKIHQLEEELEDVKYSSSSASCYSSSSNDHASLEISLRECITRLEESEHSMKKKIKCLENERNELLIELQENEQVINKNTHLQREYESLRKEFAFLKSYRSDLEDLLKNQTEDFAKREAELLTQIAALKKQKDSFEISLSLLRHELEQQQDLRINNKKKELFEDGDEIIENSRL